MDRAAGFVLCLVAMLCVAGRASAEIGDREDLCGFVYPVEGYRAQLQGLRIELPANDRLIVNGRVVAEAHPWTDGDAPAAWGDSANGASVAAAGDYVLVRTNATDCLDYDRQRIYVLTRTGALLATVSSGGGTRFALSVEGDGVIWFHTEDDCERGSIDVLRPGQHQFVRENAAREIVCTPIEEVRGRLYFSSMQPVMPR